MLTFPSSGQVSGSNDQGHKVLAKHDGGKKDPDKKGQGKKNQHQSGIYVDKKGVIRWEKSKEEAAFFGVNYTAPFAYGYRAIQRKSVDVEQAIRDDVYHFSRLGLDAFRVHVWDTEISDAQGNLINNEHLRLFDFLIAELKKRKIKMLITPIAFWGNGYPEKDIDKGGFSSKYGKDGALTAAAAIVAQENYLKQFFQHKNPYTGLNYQQDPDVLATEVNNEPHHSGAKEKTTEYVNRMVKAIRSTGWTKPVFYNISESPKYADAIVKANVQGHSFQWYPTGLVAGHTLKGNFLPNVSKYVIPFDTIPGFKNRAKIVYEFDAGDVLASYMYPAMARSFRGAGFQWATQFAYDPMATADANTEYQTHYLNLIYTPAKAISLLIASKAFHRLPRGYHKGTDTDFEDFHLKPEQGLSEFNTAEEYYYSTTTASTPVNTAKLLHIAGTGSSSTINYEGSGAYFLDKLSDGNWRLEVMPDAVQIRDPFGKASPEREVTRLSWDALQMTLHLPDLGTDFSVRAMNEGNSFTTVAAKNAFRISPGTYLLTKANSDHQQYQANTRLGVIELGDYVAPKPPADVSPFVTHEAPQQVNINQEFQVVAQVTGVTIRDTVLLEMNNAKQQWKTVPLIRKASNVYVATVPAEMVWSGVLNYKIIVRQSNGAVYSYPGNYKGDPHAWDFYHKDTFKTTAVPSGSTLTLFNPANDRDGLMVYNPDWKNYSLQYISAGNGDQLLFKAIMDAASKETLMGFQLNISDRLKDRNAEQQGFKTLVIRARSTTTVPVQVKIGLLTADAGFFSSEVGVTEVFKDIEVPLDALKADAQLLLPRPYPGFLPLHYQRADALPFAVGHIEKLEVTFNRGLEIDSIYLK